MDSEEKPRRQRQMDEGEKKQTEMRDRRAKLQGTARERLGRLIRMPSPAITPHPWVWNADSWTGQLCKNTEDVLWLCEEFV
jgi:hypothetical protein